MDQDAELPPPSWVAIAMGSWIVAILMTMPMLDREAVIQNVKALTKALADPETPPMDFGRPESDMPALAREISRAVVFLNGHIPQVQIISSQLE